MTRSPFTYDITFINGLTLFVSAPNKRQAVCIAEITHWVATCIVAVERRLVSGRSAPLALYSVRLRHGRIHTGIKLLAHDAGAAIAAARHVLALEYDGVAHMDALAMRVIRLGTGYDSSVIA